MDDEPSLREVTQDQHLRRLVEDEEGEENDAQTLLPYIMETITTTRTALPPMSPIFFSTSHLTSINFDHPPLWLCEQESSRDQIRRITLHEKTLCPDICSMASGSHLFQNWTAAFSDIFENPDWERGTSTKTRQATIWFTNVCMETGLSKTGLRSSGGHGFSSGRRERR